MVSYADLTRTRPASTFVARAEGFCMHKGLALDLGAGALRNTRFLLEKGYSVTAIDKDPVILEESSILENPKLTAIACTYDEFTFPMDAYDLVVAYNSLPFATREVFENILPAIKSSLKKGGVFCATFFGPHDTWATTKPHMTFTSKEEVQDIFAEMQILEFNEVEEDLPDILGNPKHWHVFEVIARK